LIDIKEVMKQPIGAISVLNEDSGNKTSNPNNRMSSSYLIPKEKTTGPNKEAPKEEKKPSTIPIFSECVLVDVKEVTRQSTSVVRSIGEDNGYGSSNPDNKTSNRRKKIPPARGDDFLWG
jgi:hypothetical protein